MRMGPDSYLALASTSTFEVREKASRFIASAFPIAGEVSFKEQLEAITRNHHTARHICYGWVVGLRGERFRAFDAGEPAGSAGKPILRQLQGAGLTFSAIVVVRYFGGTLLGKAGLAHAFADAAKGALANNTIAEHRVMALLSATCTYAQVEALRTDVLQHAGKVLGAEYAQQCTMQVALPQGDAAALIARWQRQGVQFMPAAQAGEASDPPAMPFT